MEPKRGAVQYEPTDPGTPTPRWGYHTAFHLGGGGGKLKVCRLI